MALVIKVPKEIKDYKEKLLFGLTVRQTVATIVSLGICMPLYLFGRKILPEDVIAWLIILIGLPIVSLGFFKYNGMPFEIAAAMLFRFSFLLPNRRLFVTENAFTEWVKEYEKSHIPVKRRDKKRLAKWKKEAGWERTFLLQEASVNTDSGCIPEDVSAVGLLTVSNEPPINNKKPKKDKKEKMKEAQTNKMNKLCEKAEHIENERIANPHYVLKRSEFNVLKNWHNAQHKSRIKEIEKGKKALKTQNEQLKKRKRVASVYPKTTQNTIPYLYDYDEGLFEVQDGVFSKMYRIQDVNYRYSKHEEQKSIFIAYREFLNYFSDEYRISVIIDNRVISREDQEREVFYPLVGDDYDDHREEYNNVLRRQIIAGNNDIQVEKYITVTINADTPIEALIKFHKIDAEVVANLRKIGSNGWVLNTTERLAYYHDKFRKGREGEFNIDYNFIKQQGISSKDYIAPTSFHYDMNEFMIEDSYYRVLFLNNLPANLADDFLSNLISNNFPVTTSINITPVATDKALRMVRKQLTGMETNLIDSERKAMKAGYSPESVNHNLRKSRKQAIDLLDDVENNDQKIFNVCVTLMVHGSSKEELEENCKVVIGKASMVSCQLQSLRFQQEEGMAMTLPFGIIPKGIMIERTLTSESTAVFMPFSNQELFQPQGFYYGLNKVSRNLIFCDRTMLKTPSGFVLGSSGSGKSFATKRELLNVLLRDRVTGVLVIDPENEYGDFCRAFGGTVIKISSDSKNYLSPMDMPPDYGLDEDDDTNTSIETKKEKAVKKKSDYLMSIIESMLSSGNDDNNRVVVTPQQKTIVDRCVQQCYKAYLDSDFDPVFSPTLENLQDELDLETSDDGRQVAEGVAYYTRGSMDLFAHHTNVEISNRLVVFNVRDLSDQLRKIALIVIFDFIWNRMVENKNKGVRTYCYCDEIHVMFDSYFSASFLRQLYKRGRKYGLCITGLTQNVEDLLKSDMARGMIGNSDFLMVLSQKAEDLKMLADMLNISEAQMGFVRGAEAGSGLLFADNIVVPFEDHFPEDSYLYKLMSTKFGDNMSKDDVDRKIRELLGTTPNNEDMDDFNASSMAV